MQVATRVVALCVAFLRVQVGSRVPAINELMLSPTQSALVHNQSSMCHLVLLVFFLFDSSLISLFSLLIFIYIIDQSKTF